MLSSTDLDTANSVCKLLPGISLEYVRTVLMILSLLYILMQIQIVRVIFVHKITVENVIACSIARTVPTTTPSTA